MFRAFFSCLLLIIALIGDQGKEALSSLTGLKVYTGTYQYLKGTTEIAIKARGRDMFGYSYKILIRWTGGYPQIIWIGGPETEA